MIIIETESIQNKLRRKNKMETKLQDVYRSIYKRLFPYHAHLVQNRIPGFLKQSLVGTWLLITYQSTRRNTPCDLSTHMPPLQTVVICQTDRVTKKKT